MWRANELMQPLHLGVWKMKTEPQWNLSASSVLSLASTDPSPCDGGVFKAVYPDVARRGPSYLKLRQQSRKTFQGTVAHAHALKITVFSIRVGSMGSMEARGRLSLPDWGKWCVWRWADYTPAPYYNLHNRGRAPGAREAEDEGGTATAGDLPRAGKSKSVHQIPNCANWSDCVLCCVAIGNYWERMCWQSFLLCLRLCWTHCPLSYRP